MTIIPNCPYVYALSFDLEVLQQFLDRLIKWTPKKYLKYLTIEICDLTEDIKRRNLMDHPYLVDVFYLEGIINNGKYFDLNGFTEEVWNWWDIPMEEDPQI